MFVSVSDRFLFFRAFTMSLKGVLQGLDASGDPIQGVPVLCRRRLPQWSACSLYCRSSRTSFSLA